VNVNLRKNEVNVSLA
jgi:hypothetical protein